MKTAKISTKATIADFNTTQMGTVSVSNIKKSVAFKKASSSESKGASSETGDRYLYDIDTDLTNLFLLAQGRVRFGDVGNGLRGENMSGEYRVFTTSTANTEFAVYHTLGSIPTGYLITSQDKAGDLYVSGKAWTSTYAYFKCSVATVKFNIFLLK